MEENKQVVAEWKQQNQDRLKEIKTFNPDLYSAINMALSYLNKTLTGEELPVEVEETIIEPQQSQELSIEEASNEYALFEFYDTKIIVDTPEKSAKFQQLIIDLGGKWNSQDVPDARLRKIVNYTDKKYLSITSRGDIFYFDTEKQFQDEITVKEIFYDDIFEVVKSPVQSHSSKQPSRTTSQTSEWRFKTKQELESEFGTDFRRYSVPEGYFNDWYGQNLAEIYSPKYQNIKQAEDSLQSNSIELGLSGFSLPTKYFTKDILTSSETNGFKLPIDTYPLTLKFKYPFFEANDGSRKSPTQSAGDLKREVSNLTTGELKEIINTKFRGNDGKWYEINVGKGGVWTWKKLNDVDNKAIEAYFEVDKLKSAQQSTSSSVQSTATKYDYATMSDIWLVSLAKDTREARDAFDLNDPEYAELTTQLDLILDEMKRRDLL